MAHHADCVRHDGRRASLAARHRAVLLYSAGPRVMAGIVVGRPLLLGRLKSLLMAVEHCSNGVKVAVAVKVTLGWGCGVHENMDSPKVVP